MERFNVLNQIHKGLNALLGETALLVQQTDYKNVEKTEQLFDQLKETIEILFIQHEQETNYFFTYLINPEPITTKLFIEEHKKINSLCDKLKRLMIIVEHVEGNSEKMQAGTAIKQTYFELFAFTLSHLAKEKEIFSEILWKHYNDYDLKSVVRDIYNQMDPHQLKKRFRWMVIETNSTDIIHWLKEVKLDPKKNRIDVLLQLIDHELPYYKKKEIMEELIDFVPTLI